MLKKVVIGIFMILGVMYGNNSAQINVNNNTLELVGDIGINEVISSNSSSNYYLTISYLITDNDSEDSQRLTTAGVKILNPYVDNYGLSLGLGIKNVYTSQSDLNLNAVALGMFIRYELNQIVYFNLEGSYAPKVLTFMDGENYRDLKFKVNYKILEDGYIYLGTRSINIKYENNSDIKFDTSAFVGYEFRF